MQFTEIESCEIVAKSYAKINIFLKIVGKTRIKGVNYHLLQSRFMRLPFLYDTLGFKFGVESFNIIGDFDCKLEQNTIYKALNALLPHITPDKKHALQHISILVKKEIPSGGGLGGGSANAACFLQVVNAALNLGLSDEALMQIGAEVGSDVPFFLSGLEIANVTGRGEVIAPCDEKPFLVDIIKPNCHCSTAKVFAKYAQEFYDSIKVADALKESWLQKSNAEILKQDSLKVNDLLAPVLMLYPELESYSKTAFLSGSGSCFWRISNALESKDSTREML